MLWLLIVQMATLMSLIDYAVRRLPTVFVAVTAMLVVVGVGISALLAHRPQWLLNSVLAGGCLGGVYLLLALAVQAMIGLGDVRLAGVLGAALGPLGWSAVALGAVLPYVVALPFAIAEQRRPASDGQIPFGPFLAAGAVIAAALAS